MRIERNISPYLVFSEDSVLTALRKIQENGQRIVFCVDARGVLQASLSDGDFRRWILSHQSGDLSVKALAVANRAVRSALLGTDPAELAGYFHDGVAHVPLVDERGHLVAIAVDRPDTLRIGRHEVGDGKPALLIAEIGINHNGSVDLAKRLVDLAKEARADVVKFQLRDMDALYRSAGADSAGEDLGPQYTLDLLSRFSLGRDELFEVFDHARDVDIDVMCTPWDAPSVQALVDYGVPALKIASADLTNHELLRDASSRGVPLVLSTGMSRESEIRESAELMQRSGSPFAMLHCQSTYPAPFKDVNLAYMDRLAEIGQCPVGYSGHERGWHVPIAAVARGAHIVEKHFTIDRGMEGNDHKVSLLPDEFAAMAAQIREVEEAMGGTEPRQVSTGEMMNRVNLAKSLIAARPVAKGQIISAEDVAVKSPGRGLQPNALPQLVGRVSRRDVEAGDFFYEADLQDRAAARREYSFRRPWGLAVRYHDYEPLLNDSNMDFVEFHFSYKDLDLDVHEIFAGRTLPVGFTTHSPDLFAGDFLLNLASEDEEHWERSIRELQRVVHTTRQLAQYFQNPGEPVVIASLGGFTSDAHLPKAQRRRMYDRVSAGLDRVDLDGVRLGAQTLPPFPWYMGGQLYCNLFVDADDTAAWAERTGRGITLDVSHSKLAANFAGAPFSEFVELL
ncbi:MAG: N-acetylneuraminate synthase family protein, partial [Pseudoclavibacter sp.]|nr:N-acetylneuraminate synthase family protein [Pseudoclavibacter sp.]